METKSHVGMEQHVCLVCGNPFDTGAILLDKRLRNSLPAKVQTGWGMCKEHQELKDKGFVALVACDPAKTRVANNRVKSPSDVYRTGDLAHIRKSAFIRIFNVPVPDQMICFVEPDVIAALQKMGGTQQEGESK